MNFERKIITRIDDWNPDFPLSIIGPTGSGKTKILLDYLRKHSLSPTIFSLDSVAAYLELNIGSSKPLGSDREDFSWRCLDLICLDQKITAAILRDEVVKSLPLASDNPLVFVGGTHFYEKFILEGAGPGGPSDPVFLANLKILGPSEVRNRLIRIDERWSYLHPNDSYRIFRFGDLVLRQEITFEELKGVSASALFPVIQTLILDLPHSEQNKILGSRIRAMLRDGWVNEVEELLAKYSPASPGLLTIGYHEVVSYLQNKQIISEEALVEQVLIRHRQLAKQQRTWLRKLISSAV